MFLGLYSMISFIVKHFLLRYEPDVVTQLNYWLQRLINPILIGIVILYADLYLI